MADIVVLCREAWDSTKKPHQPVYDELSVSYRARLQDQTEGALASGGESPFEQKVFALSAQPEIPPEVKEELVAEVVAEPVPEKPKPRKASPKPRATKPTVKNAATKPAKSTKKGAKKR
jgi:hypothetical protein